MSEGKKKRGKRDGPRTAENNTQRAFNDSILMLCKWLNLSEDSQQSVAHWKLYRLQKHNLIHMNIG